MFSLRNLALSVVTLPWSPRTGGTIRLSFPAIEVQRTQTWSLMQYLAESLHTLSS